MIPFRHLSGKWNEVSEEAETWNIKNEKINIA